MRKERPRFHPTRRTSTRESNRELYTKRQEQEQFGQTGEMYKAGAGAVFRPLKINGHPFVAMDQGQIPFANRLIQCREIATT
jgi:hypothetical protein